MKGPYGPSWNQLDGLTRGMGVLDTGRQSVPVGKETAGRVFNVLGDTIDLDQPFPGCSSWLHHEKAPSFDDFLYFRRNSWNRDQEYWPIACWKVGRSDSSVVPELGRQILIQELIHNIAQEAHGGIFCIYWCWERTQWREWPCWEMKESENLLKKNSHGLWTNEWAAWARMRVASWFDHCGILPWCRRSGRSLVYRLNIFRSRAGSEVSALFGTRVPSADWLPTYFGNWNGNVQERIVNEERFCYIHQAIYVPGWWLQTQRQQPPLPTWIQPPTWNVNWYSGDHPAVDPIGIKLTCPFSRNRRREELTMQSLREVKRVSPAFMVQDIIAILGMDELSDEERPWLRARRIQFFLSQNFNVAEQFGVNLDFLCTSWRNCSWL